MGATGTGKRPRGRGGRGRGGRRTTCSPQQPGARSGDQASSSAALTVVGGESGECNKECCDPLAAAGVRGAPPRDKRSRSRSAVSTDPGHAGGGRGPAQRARVMAEEETSRGLISPWEEEEDEVEESEEEMGDAAAGSPTASPAMSMPPGTPFAGRAGASQIESEQLDSSATDDDDDEVLPSPSSAPISSVDTLTSLPPSSPAAARGVVPHAH